MERGVGIEQPSISTLYILKYVTMTRITCLQSGVLALLLCADAQALIGSILFSVDAYS